jgi:DNA relaxase NicK
MQVYPMNIKFGGKEETIVCEMTDKGCIVIFRDRRIHFTKFGKDIRKQIVKHIMFLEKTKLFTINEEHAK